MASTQNKMLEICRQNLFENPTEKLPESTHNRLIRIRAAYTHWNEFPMKSELEIKDFLLSFGVKKSMAYYDLEIIKVLLGSVKNAGKEWHRYRVISMIEEAYQLAKEKQDPKAMGLIIDKYGKYTQLNIPDHEQIPYEDIVPQPFEPTSDPSVVGIKPVPDIRERIKKLKEKYYQDIDENIREVDYVEIMPDEKEEQ